MPYQTLVESYVKKEVQNHGDLVDRFKVKLETFWDLAMTNHIQAVTK